jgi:hypothetical protein
VRPEDALEFSESFGTIGAGWYRQVAWAESQGIPKALGLTTREWVEKFVGGYVKLALEDRRGAVKELVSEGRSQRQIADVIGVDEATVRRDVAAFAAPEPEIEHDVAAFAAPEPEVIELGDPKDRAALVAVMTTLSAMRSTPPAAMAASVPSSRVPGTRAELKRIHQWTGALIRELDQR